MVFRKLALACALVAVPIGAAVAQNDDIMSKIINKPGSVSVNGAKPKSRTDSGVQGGKAIRVNVTKGKDLWSTSLNSAIDKPVKAGDNIVLAFWARLETGPEGATTSTIQNAAVQLNSAPWTAVAHGQPTIGPDWKLHEVKGKADKDYKPGELGATIQLGDADRTIDFGPLFVLDLGQ
jgi:hypothetical protein